MFYRAGNEEPMFCLRVRIPVRYVSEDGLIADMRAGESYDLLFLAFAWAGARA